MRADIERAEPTPDVLLQTLITKTPEIREKLLLSMAGIRGELELDLRRITTG